METLDGTWRVERESGFLPPLVGVRKTIRGPRGQTRVGVVRVPFDVRGFELRYRPPFSALVDLLEPDGDGFRGRATLLGHQLGTFRMRRTGAPN